MRARNKKGQFFIASLVVLTVLTLIVFSHMKTTDSLRVKGFHVSHETEFMNLVNIIEEKNSQNANDWYDVNWKYRKKYSAGTCATTEKTFDFDSNNHDDQNDCDNELVATTIINPFSKITIKPPVLNNDCTQITLTCADGISNGFYVYYGNPNANEGNALVVGTPTPLSNFEQTAMLNCTQIRKTYQTMGISLNCSVADQTSQTVTYKLDFSTLDLKFSGNVN